VGAVQHARFFSIPSLRTQFIGVSLRAAAQEKKALRRILMEKKAHLTSEGLENICLIKAGMNRGRVEFSQSDLGRRRRLRVAALRIN
jgi:DNA polymerase III delta prime subunit